MTCPITLTGFDPISKDFLTNPYPWYEKAKKEAPVFYHPALDFWVVTGHENVCKAARDFKTFSSKALDSVPPPADFEGKAPRNFASSSIVAIDPPEHTATRAALQRFFTPSAIAKMSDHITQASEELIDQIEDRGACDLMQDFCYPLSLEVVVEFLGVPKERKLDYRQWTEDLFSIYSPRSKNGVVKPMPEEESRERWARLAESARFFTELSEERKKDPKNDPLTAMVMAKDKNGEPAIPADRILTHMNELVAAGNDTTANLIGHMVLLFTQNPDQLAKVLQDPSLWPNAVEEGLRMRGTSPGLFRITTRDVEIGGTTIPAESVVWLLYSSGGLDEDKFADPMKFDVTRPNASEHISFGHGRHTCLGNPLARLEARLALEALYRRLPNLRALPDQDFVYLPTMTVLTLEHLQVEWGTRAT